MGARDSVLKIVWGSLGQGFVIPALRARAYAAMGEIVPQAAPRPIVPTSRARVVPGNERGKTRGAFSGPRFHHERFAYPFAIGEPALAARQTMFRVCNGLIRVRVGRFDSVTAWAHASVSLSSGQTWNRNPTRHSTQLP